MKAVCTVKIVDLGWLGIGFKVHCNKCNRLLGTFSQHESAMNWAQAHARSLVHIRA